MECSIRNDLVLSYLLCQARQAETENAVRASADSAAGRRLLEAAQAALLASRKALLDHCDQHGC